ncbi:MAG: sugar phosphate isomerase/epimerase [Planctomycetia bacterium]|nr:sugar phosphate isomerase/epimerase [Planctomycetia bacterium]
MFVAASTDCFPELPVDAALSRLVDLEFSRVEISLHEHSNQLKPSDVANHYDDMLMRCRQTYRLTPVAFSVDIAAEGDEYYRQFAACCRLAKAIKVVAITVPGAELGTPFNAEVERLRELVALATTEGVVVGVKTETGRVTQDADTVVVLCDNVKGLGVTLDPSHFVYGRTNQGNYDQLLKYVCHVQLRDTSKNQLQVRIGQGAVEYGRLVTQLAQVGYDRALSIHVQPLPDVEHAAEMRKIRLLLESLL